ncbi:MAG: PfkB family carbohydrate kinase [Bacteroidota bacterium]|nr:PfkB family carbohydrate kinase [Bacteroidota bacterium]MDP4217339.1 PfkB family carbohydrate kinase [Bacteroidota bacterium]MDP4245776.1 PfkB family carbohydrate kinase [Bacteroidota bacterium]MDP4253565.1 PfkB family carbohydrate kinase [Bacteroidota bacterium]MDP4257078.1 PfkB family carbohydrate kinase [Bacteroidota bacterium]
MENIDHLTDKTYDICCIGHITLDKVVTPLAVKHMPGGTSVYFSNAIRNMDLSYLLVTALGQDDMQIVDDLRDKGIDVQTLPSAHTVCFENIYTGNLDHRTQRVTRQADPFTAGQLQPIKAKVFHLGPLLAGDIPLESIRALSVKGIVSLDVQGYLRKVKDEQVCAVDWPAKREALACVDILKANESEMHVLTGYKEVRKSAKLLASWGVKEVVITLGSKGSVILHDDRLHTIPAYTPETNKDTTGCGDTYMAGYLYKRIRGAGIQEAGEFAAAMATLKIGSMGPFTGTSEDVLRLLGERKKNLAKSFFRFIFAMQ